MCTGSVYSRCVYVIIKTASGPKFKTYFYIASEWSTENKLLFIDTVFILAKIADDDKTYNVK